MTITLAQNVAGATVNNVVNTGTAVYNNPTVNGNTLVAWISSWGSGQQVTSITDNFGNTWQRFGTVNQAAGNNETLECWYSKNIIGGSTHTMTITMANVENIGADLFEYSSNVGTVDVDQGTFTATGTTGTTATSGAITPSQNNAILNAGGTDSRAATTTVVAGSGYTLRGMAGTANNSVRIYGEDRTLATAASSTATFTSLQSGSRWVISLISLKETTTPPSALPVGTLMMMGCGI